MNWVAMVATSEAGDSGEREWMLTRSEKRWDWEQSCQTPHQHEGFTPVNSPGPTLFSVQLRVSRLPKKGWQPE